MNQSNFDSIFATLTSVSVFVYMADNSGDFNVFFSILRITKCTSELLKNSNIINIF